MKIAMFLETYKPHLNGVVLSAISIKKYLESKGHVVYIFTTGKFKEKNVFSAPNFNFTQGYGPSIPFYNNDKLLSQVDIFHTHQPFLLGLYARRKARKFNKPIIMTSHCQYHNYTHYIPLFGKKLNWFVKKYVGWFMNSCNRIILPSQSFKKTLVNDYHVKNKKIQVIPNGIVYPKIIKRNISIFNKYNLDNKKVLIFCGRIGKEKNLEFLIRMFKILNSHEKNTVLFIIGGGPEEKNIRNLVNKLNLQNSVFMTGFIENKKVFDYLSNGDLFVSSSKSEIHPLTLLEAMNSSLVPVTLNSPGFVDTIDDGVNGILIKKENEKEFATKILRLIRDSRKLERMKELARLKSLDYSIENICGKIEDLYNHENKKLKLKWAS